MVNDKMCVGVREDSLMLRVHPELYEDLLEKEGCRPMEFTGRAMPGFVYVDMGTGLNTKKKMQYWLQLALDYNKVAKVSKKRALKAKTKLRLNK